MKKPVAKKQLHLTTTTVRALQDAQLAQIAGGYYSSMCPETRRCELSNTCAG